MRCAPWRARPTPGHGSSSTPPPTTRRSATARSGRCSAAASDADPGARVAAGDLWTLMYTSGTTGLPKGIQHTHFIRAMYATTLASAWRMAPESVVLHSGAIVFNGAMTTMLPAFMLRSDVRAASRVRRRGVHRDRRARARHAHDARALADHRGARTRGRSTRRASRRSRRCSRSARRCTRSTRTG